MALRKVFAMGDWMCLVREDAILSETDGVLTLNPTIPRGYVFCNPDPGYDPNGQEALDDRRCRFYVVEPGQYAEPLDLQEPALREALPSNVTTTFQDGKALPDRHRYLIGWVTTTGVQASLTNARKQGLGWVRDGNKMTIRGPDKSEDFEIFALGTADPQRLIGVFALLRPWTADTEHLDDGTLCLTVRDTKDLAR